MNEETKEESWSLNITRVNNGYILKGSFGEMVSSSQTVIEESEDDELKSHEQLLWEIMDYFAFSGNKHASERIWIVRQKKKDIKSD